MKRVSTDLVVIPRADVAAADTHSKALVKQPRAVRFAVLWPVTLRDSGGEVVGRIVNISKSGVQLVSPKPLDVRSRVDVVTKSDDLPLMRFSVEIIRQREAADGYAYGARIAQITPATFLVLSHVMEGLQVLRADREENQTRDRVPIQVAREQKKVNIVSCGNNLPPKE
ncbi:MAG TPA: PilZ domain-containing protein [Chthonomonadaceae bacterium]|nr:PilZ domain-containing protein [Chthonomonadaceae bacterium]